MKIIWNLDFGGYMGWFSPVAIYFLMPLSSNVEDIEKKKKAQLPFSLLSIYGGAQQRWNFRLFSNLHNS